MNNPIITASGAIPAYACVKVSTSGSERVEVATLAADVVFGVTLAANTPAGGVVDFQTTDSQLDIFTLKAAGPIAIGQYVVPTTNGTVIGATTGPFVALDPATTGQTFTARKFNAGATANFLAPGTGATTRTLDSKLSDTLSVKDFGAIGDGSTDDTVALQAALTAGTGKGVYVPAGTYNTSAALNVFANTTLYSDQGSGIINVLPTASTTTVNHGIIIAGNNVVIDGIRVNGTNEHIVSVDTGLITAVAKGILADSAISGGVFLSPTIRNCILFQWSVGIELRRASNFVISGNRLIGGAQQGVGNAGDFGNTDIGIFGSASTSLTSRGIISNNFCYGNQDTGIGWAGIYDRFIICTGNIIQPMAADGVTPIGTGAANKSRYGILACYGGGNATGINSTISNNIITDYGNAGISSQAQTRPGGDMVISGNVITNCGWNTANPANASLKGGMFIVGGADTISGNIILDCFRVGINLNATNAIDPAIQHSRQVVTGNVISRLSADPLDAELGADTGWGILIAGSHPNGALITGNRIERTANWAIRSFGENVHIVDNSILISSVKGGIQVAQTGTAGTLANTVQNNRIVNTDNTTNAVVNSGILITGFVHCIGNVIDKFFVGIRRNENITGRDISTKCSSNVINNCNNGILCSGDGTWIVSDNTIFGCSTDLGNNVFQGVLVKAASFQGAAGGFKVICCDSVSPQTLTGNWAVGDRFINSACNAVGQDKGWICITAGKPGVWRSEGLLT